MTRYGEVAADLRRRIQDGEFPAGTMLPGEERLAAWYSVSRGTVRNALSALARRGMVLPRDGAGWVVRALLPARQLGEYLSFAQWAEEIGLTPGGQVIGSELAAATQEEAGALRLARGDEVLRCTRLRTLDGKVVTVERTTWAPWAIPAIMAIPPESASVTAVLAAAGIHTAYGTHRFEPVAASSDDARLLGVRRSSPLLQVTIDTFAQDDRIIGHGKSRYLPNSVAFEVAAAAPIGAERAPRR